MIKRCKHCGKEFETNNPQKIYCDDVHYRPCPVCGKPVAMIDNDFTRAPRCCSNECKTLKRKRNLPKKICAFCGEEFIPKSGVSTLCDRQHFQTCVICGKVFEVSKKQIHDNIRTCSKECSREYVKKLNLEKYGAEHPMQTEKVRNHHRQAMKIKYGVESPLQSKEIRQKAIDTMQERYGTDWALSNEDIKAKAEVTMLERYGGKTTLESPELKEKVYATMTERYGGTHCGTSEELKNRATKTLLEKYGVDNAMKCPEIHARAQQSRIEHYGEFWPKEIDDKAKQTFLSRYGVTNPSYSKELMDKARETCMIRYGVPYGVLIPAAQAHVNRISKTNIAIHDIFESKGIKSEYEFYLGGKLYDLKLKDTNILIEIDPTYTHNAIGNHWDSTGLDKYYHRDKSELAEKFGYRCIHIFDWDDINMIVNMLLPKKKIHARKCKIFKLKPEVGDQFLNENHIQGTCRGQLLYLGLVLDGELYQVMTFGKARYDKVHDIELLRLATKAGYQVSGGASKLFAFATQNYGLYNIISYCDRSKFTGNIYETIGMKHIRNTPPQEVWSFEESKITANLLRQRGFDQLFKTNYGKGTSNELLMVEHGWLPVYDCGQSVYEYK